MLLTPFFPYPADSGGNTRSLNLLKRLGSQGVDLVLVIISTEEPNAEAWAEFHRMMPHVKTIRLEYDDSPRQKAFYYMLNLIHADRLFCYRKTKKEIRDLAKLEKADLVHVDYSQTARFLPPSLASLSILAYIEFRTRVLTRQHRIAETGRRGPRERIREWLMRREELSHLGRYDAFICMSEEDRKWLLRQGKQVEAFVVENGVDPADYAFSPPGERIRGIYYLGWFTNRQNALALDFFVDQVWPLIRDRIPDFFVAGKGLDPQRRERLAREGIEYKGFMEIPALREQTAGRALVVPLLSGSGTRLKILEAMAAGSPVVSTKIGAEGLEARDGHEVLIGDNAEELAARTLRLIEEPGLAARLAANARRLVEARYDWDILAGKLFDIYSSIVSGQAHEPLNALTCR